MPLARFAVAAGALAMISGAFPALAQDAAPVQQMPAIHLAPSSDWVMDYAEDSCALRRTFGEAGRQVHLELRRFGPSPDFQGIVASADLQRGAGPIILQVLPVRPAQAMPRGFDLDYGEGLTGRLFAYDLAASSPQYDQLFTEFIASTPVLSDQEREIVRTGRLANAALSVPNPTLNYRVRRAHERLVASDEYQGASRRAFAAFWRSPSYNAYLDELAGAVTQLLFLNAVEVPVVLETGSLRSALDAMDTCIDELLTHWGVDAAAHRTLLRGPEPYDYRRLYNEVADDYPAAMSRDRRSGFLRVRLDVSTEGMPTGCHIQADISDESFKRVACDNMMRFARFYPALDAAGQPVASFFQISVMYVMGR